jgi:polysaccharide chain length determinant protein (PEP-CTERM system associated)
MQEVINQILDEVRGAWRYRRVALAIAWVVCLLGWAYVLVMPDKFEAKARVFVDPTTALRPVIEGLAVEQDVNAELNLVRQSLLSELQLQKVVDATGLGVLATTPQKKERVIYALRDRIDLTVLGAAPPGGEDPYSRNPSKIYTIRYLDSNRERSLKVVQILLNNFMEGTLGGKRLGSQQAQKFLEDQIHEYERRLSDSEQQLAEFKKRNVGMVPGEQRGDYFTRLQAEMDSVKTSQTTLNAALIRRDTLQKQLRGEAPIAASGGTAQGAGAATPGNPVGGGDTVSRIKEAQARLDELLLKFTDKHPDVVAMRRTLEDLKERRAGEMEALRRGDANAAALTGASANPVYQNIQLSLNQVEVEIASARAALQDHQEKVADFRRFADTMPQVEAEFARLNRDYLVTKAQYTALAERLEKARVGEEAEASGSIRFEVIDPPSSPFKPVSPKRLLLLVAVLFAGIIVGIAFAYLLNLLKPVFYNIRTLARSTGVTVLGAISLTHSEDERGAMRGALFRYGALVGVLFVVFLAAAYLGLRYAPLLANV